MPLLVSECQNLVQVFQNNSGYPNTTLLGPGLHHYKFIITLRIFHFAGSNSLFSFGYKLPSNSYAIFRIPSKSFSSEGGQQNEFIREKRNLLVNSNRMGRQLTTSEKSKTSKQYHHENQNCAANWTKLDGTFPLCVNYTNCDTFGQCLTEKYPQTKILATSKDHNPWLTSEVIEFDSDEACTNFVQEFFVKCKHFMESCKNLKNNVDQAYPMLGCLFREYPDLMLPIFHQKSK